MDLVDFEAKGLATGTKYLLLSRMRADIACLARVIETSDRHGIAVIEDCTHTMGASQAGKPNSTFGEVSCFSLQAYRHGNDGEGIEGIALPQGPQAVAYVPSSIQFRVLDLDEKHLQDFLEGCRSRGVLIKWFGSVELKRCTSLSGRWRYLAEPHTLPATLTTLERLCDRGIPLNLPLDACNASVDVIQEPLTTGR